MLEFQDVKNIKVFDRWITLDECQSIFNALKTLEGIEDTKHYLGDIKWVIYQYICDMGGDSHNDRIVNVRCGNFAFNKLTQNVPNKDICDRNHIWINLNGEDVYVHHSCNLEKKQLILSGHDYGNKIFEAEKDITIYSGDIVLYFA